MSAIRPDLPNIAPQVPAGPTAGMRAAQAAFFKAALAGAETTPARPAATASAEQTTDAPRLPRPGQLLDIRV